MKTVYLWVHFYERDCGSDKWTDIEASLAFTSKEKFLELLGYQPDEDWQLVPIQVPDTFDNLDCIPDNY